MECVAFLTMLVDMSLSATITAGASPYYFLCSEVKLLLWPGLVCPWLMLKLSQTGSGDRISLITI